MDNKEESNLKSKAKKKLVRWGIFAGVLLIAFLLGFVPMWLNARNCAAEHEVTKKVLVKEEIENLITTAIVDARRGEYEPARKDASDFFTKLRTETDKGEESAYPAEQNEKLKTVFATRDAVITMLAQRDQASEERLTDVYLAYHKAIGQERTVTENQPSSNANTETNSQ